MKTIIILLLVAWATYISAASVDLFKRDEPLSVQLTAAGNSLVKLVVMNNGDAPLNLLSTGTLLDDKRPVERITLYSNHGSTKVPFEGIRIHLQTSALSVEDFLVLEAGEKKELKIEAAAIHDLSNGGNFDVFTNGVLPYPNANSTELVGALKYESNKLSISVDGNEAATVRKLLVERAIIGTGCTDFNYAVIQEARSNCHHLALGAAAAAAGGDIRLETLFKSLSISVRNEVSARMSAVARTCGTEWPSTIFNCNDALGFCTNSIPAYYSAQVNPMTYCPPFFNRIKPVSREYLGFDQGTSILHETTHVPGVYSPPTQDLAYTYTYSAKLSTGEALRNADSYTVFAQFIRQNCIA